MLAALTGAMLTIAGVGFDLTPFLRVFYPGREVVSVTASDGSSFAYACKPGPVGETPQAQAERAHVAFEENLDGFADAFVGKMMTDIEEDTPALATGLTLQRDAESWARASAVRLEREFGCIHLG
jgi:hypothetical protein